MNEKLSLQDLVDLLSKKAKITKKDADAFFRELFQLILERIFDNDFVKIKDFGTFKLISVSSRESVNVNTGEKIEIPSHYKLSFIPDKVLKNLVNKPFSQFETILLEDGVVFEATVDSEDDLDGDESVEIAEVDIDKSKSDADIVNEAEKSIDDESVSLNSNRKLEVKEQNTQDTENPKSSNSRPSVNQVYPKSFVYTYTTSSSQENTGSIILTVPKDDLQVGTSVSKTEDQTTLQEVQGKKEFPIELKDLPDIPVINNDGTSVAIDEEKTVSGENKIEEIIVPEIEESESLSESILESEKKSEQPKIPVLENEEPLVVPLIKNIIADDIELESDFESEIETEEDVIIPVPITEKVVKDEEEQVLSQETSVKVVSKPVFSNEDPERPLFPGEDDEEIIDDLSFVPLSKKLSKGESDILDEEHGHTEPVNKHSFAGNNKPTEIRSVSFSDTIDPVDIPYTDYNNHGGSSKLRKWLPVILFFLVIVGFLAYGLVKMLRKPYDYEYNLGRTNLSLSDTLPLVDEVSPQVQTTDALLDSMKSVQRGLVEDTVKPVKQEPIVAISQQPEVKEEVKTVASNIVGEADSLTTELINNEKNSFVISDKLKFVILNKGEYHLQKYADENKKEIIGALPSQAVKVDGNTNKVSKPQYSTIRRGTTLRTMAATYYGSPDYWVYIYQANKNNIANPNNVPIGTRLLIPSLSDYGVFNPKDAKAIETAKSLEAKILKKR